MLDLFVVTNQQDVMSLDGMLSSHPVSAPLDDPARINEVFDDIPYKKGQSRKLLLMLILQMITLIIKNVK